MYIALWSIFTGLQTCVSYLNRSTGRNLSVGGYLFNYKTMKPVGVSLQADLSLDICLSPVSYHNSVDAYIIPV